MAWKRDVPPITGNRLVANLVGIFVLLMLIGVCIAGAVAGIRKMQMHEYGDFMSPIWFVASGFGAVVLTIILVGMAAETAAYWASARRKRRAEGQGLTGAAD